jgi:sulfatase maturation enzyme AslB (radical SAM superfamily)
MDSHKPSRSASLTKIFVDRDDQGTHVGRRLNRLIETAELSERPPFPRQIQIETSNICNHKCDFCAYPTMVRPRQFMDAALFERLTTEAFELGAREIGLFAGAEPLTCASLEDDVAFCRRVGYEYIYISTNGALADEARWRRLLDAGLSSIKFSVNAATRESYLRVHGRDHFDKVLENIRFVASYRPSAPSLIYVGASYVGTPDTTPEFPTLKALLDPYVDEVLFYEVTNQSGQKPDLPPPPFTTCVLPFNKLHISVEGYIKACCNDYDNYLAIDDLTTMPLADAWHSERFQALRRLHLDDRLDGTLCGKCIRRSAAAVKPLNDELLSEPVRLIQIDRRRP